VINALKHAFPHGREGKILVRYAVEGSIWTLTVSDDGAGMSPDKKTATAGLGTSIVEALTAQLGGELVISSSAAGTTIAINKKAPDAVLLRAL